MRALWVVFPVIAFSVSGTVVWVAASCRPDQDEDRAGDTSEVRAWWRLMAPLLAGTLVVAFLSGWASQEPDPADEWVGAGLCSFAGLVGTLTFRALLRALRSVLSARRVVAPIATVGLLRCRAVVSEAFERLASPEVLDAALAHEFAHVRGRDPLRIWLAQLAADLQWPIPHARRRFRRWVLALEMQRDDEAVLAGASATALAESIILAAQLRRSGGAQPVAAITGQGDGLALRVRRLLAEEAGEPGALLPVSRWISTCCIVAIAGAAMLGAVYGDAFLLLLPGVGR